MNFNKIFFALLFVATIGISLLGMEQDYGYNSGYETDNEQSIPKLKSLIEHEDIIRMLSSVGLDLEDEWRSCINALSFDEQAALLDEEDSIIIFQEEQPMPSEFLVVEESGFCKYQDKIEAEQEAFNFNQTVNKKQFPEKFNAKLKILQDKISSAFDLLKNKFHIKAFEHKHSNTATLKKLGFKLKENFPYSHKYYKFSAKFPSTSIDIINALKIVVLRYFLKITLDRRLSDGDQFIYDLPRLSAFIKITPKHVKVYGYPSARQDELFSE